MKVEDKAKILGALGQSTRLHIYNILQKNKKGLTKTQLLLELIKITDTHFDRSTLEFHLRKMDRAGILNTKGRIVKLKKTISIKIKNLK
jgi:hypothetical protein